MVGSVSASGIVLRTFRFAPSPHCALLFFCRVSASGIVLRTFRFAPSPHAWRRGASRLRPRVARVLRTTPLATMPSAASLHRQGGAHIARLRPLVARVLRTTPLTARHISTPADSCRRGPHANFQSAQSPPAPASTVHPQTVRSAPLTSLEGTTNLSSCIGLSTIIRHGAIYHRAVLDHRLSHG